MIPVRPRIGAWLGALSWLTAATAAEAAPPCSSLPNPVYLQVGDTQEPLMKALGQKLRASAVQPITLIYKTSGSCTNIEAMYSDVKLTTNPSYVPSAAEDPAWDPSMPAPQCEIDPGGVTLDVTNSNVFVSACTQAAPPAGVAEFIGPVQPYVFIVPKGSSQQAITAEQGYFVFGFGQAGGAEPWTDEAFVFSRTTTKSTLLAIAAAIRVPPSKCKGKPFDKSSEVMSAVATSTSPEKTIGLMGAEIYDANRDKVSSLAYQAYQQTRAYFADSTSSSRDKRNVRDGHYTIWSPTVYLARVDAAGQVTNPRVAYVLKLILSEATTPTPDFDPLSIVVGRGLVPECAMKVQRAEEGGDLSPYAPAAPCGCAFEAYVGSPSAACVACGDDAACGAGKCRFGFCEER